MSVSCSRLSSADKSAKNSSKYNCIRCARKSASRALTCHGRSRSQIPVKDGRRRSHTSSSRGCCTMSVSNFRSSRRCDSCVGACMLLMLGLPQCVATVDSDIVRPNSNVTIANGAAILGFSGGLYICGIRPQHSEWIQAVDANGIFTQKVVFSGDQRKADHVYVVDKYDGCYYFCVRHASFEDAGLYQLYDRRHHQNVGGGFLLVTSRAISQLTDGDISAERAVPPSDRIAAASVDGRQVFRVDYAGLMEPYQCRNELGHDVMTCRCGKNSTQRSFIECEASAAVPWNEVTATGCPIRFYPNPHYLNAANDSVCLNSSVLANVTANDGQTASDSRNQWHTWLSAIIIVSSLIVIIAIIFVYKACISKKWSWRSVSSADVQKCVEQSAQFLIDSS